MNSEKIHDKPIILLLGTTGSGKSTFTHLLCQSKMEKVTLNGIESIIPTEYRDDLSHIKVSSGTISETLYISPVSINSKNLGSYRNTEYIIVDCAG